MTKNIKKVYSNLQKMSTKKAIKYWKNYRKDNDYYINHNGGMSAKECDYFNKIEMLLSIKKSSEKNELLNYFIEKMENNKISKIKFVELLKKHYLIRLFNKLTKKMKKLLKI